MSEDFDISPVDELRLIAEALRERLALLRDGGVGVLPKPAVCRRGWATFEGMPSEARGFSPCPEHASWQGAAFGVWTLGNVAVVWGEAIADASEIPYSASGLDQLGKILGWLSGQLGSPAPDINTFRLFASGRCLEGGHDREGGASSSLSPLIDGWIDGQKPEALLLMGGLAAGLKGAAEAMGKIFESRGVKLMATWSPDEIASDERLKKESFAHLKGFIKTIASIN